MADNFFNSGYDVVVSGIDTTEALVEAGKLAAAGKKVWAIPYDFAGALRRGPDGLPGCALLQLGSGLSEGRHRCPRRQVDAASGIGSRPDWTDINNPDTSAVGFKKGEGALGRRCRQGGRVHQGAGRRPQSVEGPLNLQDGTVYLKDGEAATDQQIWYLPQLLQGMEGQSVSQ